MRLQFTSVKGASSQLFASTRIHELVIHCYSTLNKALCKKVWTMSSGVVYKEERTNVPVRTVTSVYTHTHTHHTPLSTVG